LTSSARLREVADQVAAAHRIVKDARKVDVQKWGVPDDAHLLRSPSAFIDDVQALFVDRACKGDKMPATKAANLLQFRPGEVTIWAGYKESYKTTFLNELFTFWACGGIQVAEASLETPAPLLLQTTIRQALATDQPSAEQIERVLERLSETMTIYDVVGRLPLRHMLAVMMYCAVELGCRHFLLDNLSILLSIDNDRQAEHQAFIADTLTIAKSTGMHIHLVAHLTKPENGDESKFPNGYAIRGTGTAPDLVHNILLIWRNKPKEAKMDGTGPIDEAIRRQPDLQVRVDKQRYWDYRGTLAFWINRRCLRFQEYGFTECTPFL
jgi:twinkle protein